MAPGAVVMLLRNLDVDAGLCNGVRLLVVHALPSVLDCLIISGSRTSLGKRVYIPRVSLAPKLPDLPFILRRRQFPVKLAWAITINKSQGQSLLRVGVHLPTPVFSHGQLYVALSRAGSSSDIRVLVADGEDQGFFEASEGIEAGVYTHNVVWSEALLSSDFDAGGPSQNRDRRVFLKARFVLQICG